MGSSPVQVPFCSLERDGERGEKTKKNIPDIPEPSFGGEPNIYFAIKPAIFHFFSAFVAAFFYCWDSRPEYGAFLRVHTV